MQSRWLRVQTRRHRLVDVSSCQSRRAHRRETGTGRLPHLTRGSAHQHLESAHLRRGVAHLRRGVTHLRRVAHLWRGVAHPKRGAALRNEAALYEGETVLHLELEVAVLYLRGGRGYPLHLRGGRGCPLHLRRATAHLAVEPGCSPPRRTARLDEPASSQRLKSGVARLTTESDCLSLLVLEPDCLSPLRAGPGCLSLLRAGPGCLSLLKLMSLARVPSMRKKSLMTWGLWLA